MIKELKNNSKKNKLPNETVKKIYKFICGWSLCILFFLGVFYFSYEYTEQKYIIYFLIITIFLYVLLIFLVVNFYKTYSISFINSYLSKTHLIFLLFLDFLLVCSISCLASILTQFFLYIFFISLFISIYSIYIFKKNIKLYFSNYYFKINKKVYCDMFLIILKAMHVSEHYALILACLFVFIAIQGIFSPYILTLSFVCFLFHLLILYYISEYIYFCFIFQPRIEKHFRQPVISDYWGLFEMDKKLKKKILGSDSTKTPLQYDEIFFKNNNVK